MDLARLVSWDYHVDRGVFQFDQRFYSLYGTTVSREGRFMTPEQYIREFVHPDDAHLVRQAMRGALTDTGSPCCRQLEHRILRRDGVIRHIVVRYVAMHDERGGLVGLCGANQDITERKRMEDELWQTQERLRVALRSIGDAVVITDSRGNVTMLNSLAEWLTGWREAEALGRQIDEVVHVVHDGTLERHPTPVQEVLRTGVAAPLPEHLVLCGRGAPQVAIAGSCAPLRGACGALDGAALAFRDTTEQRLAERAVSQERINLDAIFESSPVGMLVLDEHVHVTRANKAAKRLMPADVDHYLQKPPGAVLRCVHSFEHPCGCGHAEACGQCALRTQVTSVLQGGAAQHGLEVPVTVLRADRQQVLWLRVGIEPLRHTDGHPRVVVAVDDITGRKCLEEELRNAARRDRLTGLVNRTWLLERLQHAIERRKRRPHLHYAVLFLDFDRFKNVNDSLGHEQGDKLLCAISERLQAAVRTADAVGRGGTAARLGGDEFIVLLEDMQSDEAALAVAERLLQVLAAPYHIGPHEIISTASIGIVTSAFGHSRAEDVLRDADTAMYEAKSAGRGRAVMFDCSMHERAQRKLELESGMRDALRRKQFQVFYQPIVSLNSGRIVSFEALLRWRHPVHGLISPAEFIPLAEETGLIAPLGQWCFSEAARQLARWQKLFGCNAVPAVSVNLSRKQLLEQGLASRLAGQAREAGVDPSRMHVEITETTIMTNAEMPHDVLHDLRREGFRIDVDDFGVGYSSLSSLNQFPLDTIKIDRSFVCSLTAGRQYAALVHAIVTLAQNLNIAVVAEGVETPDQVVMLQALGCHRAQGYHFAKPMTADAATAFIVHQALRREVAAG